MTLGKVTFTLLVAITCVIAQEKYFTQKLDHFSAYNANTWQQRYFVNATYWKDSNSPIFFQVGGEGAISDVYVNGGLAMSTYGIEHGAMLVALEHRFYGKSKPTANLTTDNLLYLTSEQALSDAANFITWFRGQIGATEQSRVITFGCSYPGSLAAWFRIKHPEVTYASVASSAPVQATYDFYKYLDVVDVSVAKLAGEKCDSLIRAGTDIVQALVTSDSGREKLGSIFNFCQPISGSPEDIASFIANIMGIWQGGVQYNGEGRGNVKPLCDIMVANEDSPITGYAKVVEKVSNGECLPASYQEAVAQLTNLTQAEAGVGVRSWVFQTCNEFGYFQTTDSENQPFGDLVPVSYYAELCEKAFGRKFNTPQLIYDTNQIYGGKNIRPTDTSNVLFVNGNIDPWHALGVISDISDSLKAVFINGTAHCANVHAPSEDDLPSLTQARQKISAQIKVWLE